MCSPLATGIPLNFAGDTAPASRSVDATSRPSVVRIRISVESPGANRQSWKFLLSDYDREVWHAVSHSAAYPSSLLLPLPGAP